MKLVKILIASVFVLSVCKPANAFDLESVKAFGNIDLFTAGTAENRLKQGLKDEKAAGDIATYSLDTDAALGFRIGAMHPIEDLVDIGLSWGYIAGPDTDVKATMGQTYKFKADRRFYRFLLEGRKDFEINDKVSALGGIGMGWAFGRSEWIRKLPAVEYTEQGAIAPTSRNYYFNGFTWELSAGVSYKATDKINVDLGIRYAMFPRMKNEHDLYVDPDGSLSNFGQTGMQWNTLGFFTGVRF